MEKVGMLLGQETEPYPSPVTQWISVLILTLLYLVSMLDRNIVLIVGDHLKADLQISDIQLGLLYGAAFSISYGVFSLPIGWALDKYNRRNVIYTCITIWSLATISCGLIRNYAWIFISRCFVGAGEAGLTPGASTIMSDMFPPDKLAFPTSLYFSGAKLGQALSFIVGGALAVLIAPAALLSIAGVSFKGWQIILMMVGLPGLFLALLIFLIPEPVRRNAGADMLALGSYWGLLKWGLPRKRFFIGTLLGSLCYFITVIAVISWSVAYLQRVHGFSPQASGGLLGVSMLLAPLVGSPFHGWVVDYRLRSGVKDASLRHLRLMGILAMPIGMCAFFVDSAILSLAMIAVFIACLAGYSSLPCIAMMHFVPSSLRGKSIAVVLVAVSSLGSAIAPAIAAAFNEYVFGGRGNVGFGIAAVIALFIPLGAIFLTAALKPMRESALIPARI